MTESMPPTPEELRRLNRDLLEKVIDRAASDPEWKQWLLDDPEVAIEEAGFPELERFRQVGEQPAQEEDEVIGQQQCWAMTGACHYTRADPIAF